MLVWTNTQESGFKTWYFLRYVLFGLVFVLSPDALQDVKTIAMTDDRNTKDWDTPILLQSVFQITLPYHLLNWMLFQQWKITPQATTVKSLACAFQFDLSLLKKIPYQKFTHFYVCGRFSFLKISIKLFLENMYKLHYKQWWLYSKTR